MTAKLTPKQEAKNGRPTKFAPEYVEQAYKLALLGATDKQMADFWGVTEKTLNNWKHEHPDFLQSTIDGKLKADADVAESLFQRARGYSHKAVKIFNNGGEAMVVDYVEHYPPDTQAASLWLRNRQPETWRDKIDVQHGGTDELLQALAAAGERARNVPRG